MGGPKQANPRSVSDYIAGQPPAMQPTLQELRALVRSVVPEATEKISYGIIGYQHHYMLVGIGATKTDCSFYTMSPELVDAMDDQLGSVRRAGATLHFSPARPLPMALLKRIIRLRVDENEARAASRAANK